MVEDHLKLIAGVFWSEMCTKHCKAIGLPPAVTISFDIELAHSLSFFRSFFLYLFYFFALSLSLALSLSPSPSLSLLVSLSLSHSVVFVANFIRTMSYVRGVI